MKLLRFGEHGHERPGVLDSQGIIRDISAYVDDFNPQAMSDPEFILKLSALDLNTLPCVSGSVRIGACLDRPGKIVCIGLNSILHAQEVGLKVLNQEMLVFLKPSSSICGPNDPVPYAPHMCKLDWEAELAFVIGRAGKYIQHKDAEDYILGYTCLNDLTERYLQLETEDKQFTKGKGFDGAAPIGPYLVTKDEIKNPQDLHLRLWVNGVLRQSFNSSDYIHNPAQIIEYVSKYFTLHPGDIISMGSAPGSAPFWGEDCFLKPNDRMVFCIEGLGQQEQCVIFESNSNQL